MTARGVVDAGDHVLDLVGLTRDAGGQDVGVVAAGDRHQRRGPGEAGRVEHVAVEAGPHHVGAGPVLGQPLLEGPLVAVDDRDRVACLLQAHRELRPDPTASNHDDVHGCVCTPPRHRTARSRVAAPVNVV